MIVNPHPLIDTLTGVNQHEHWLPLTLVDIDSRQSLAVLVEDNEGLLEWGLTIGERLGANDIRVGPTLLFERLVNLCVLALIGPYIMARRIPLAGLEHIQPDCILGQQPGQLYMSPVPFACLPEDPAAEHPLARRQASLDALLASLREQLIRISEPLVHVMARPSRRGLNTQWRCVTDKVASVAWYVGKQAGSETTGLALAEALCVGHKPLIGQPGFRTFEYDGVSHLHRVRNTCCQHYRVPGKRLCFTCPLIKPKDRDQFWRERYDEKKKQP